MQIPPSASVSLSTPTSRALQEFSTLELAQALTERLTITDGNWHRLKADRKARSGEQIAAALVFLLQDQPEQALAHLHQATGWLDRSISAPPCKH